METKKQHMQHKTLRMDCKHWCEKGHGTCTLSCKTKLLEPKHESEIYSVRRMCQAQNATSACVKATPRSHLKLHRSDFGCTARWSHQLISNWGIPAVAAKWHGKNDEIHRPTVAAIGCTKEKLETVNGLDQGERAVVTRPAPGHPLGPQAGQEVLKDLEKVGSTKGPSRTRIPQRFPACLGADAAEDPSCQPAT